MTEHDHTSFVPGCFRCELGRDEARDASRKSSKAKRDQRKRQRDRLREEVAKRDKAITAIRHDRDRLRDAHDAAISELTVARSHLADLPANPALSVGYARVCAALALLVSRSEGPDAATSEQAGH